MTLNEYIAQDGKGAQARLAERSGVSENTMSQLANGRLVRDREVARAIARATGGKVSVATLMGLTAEDFEGGEDASLDASAQEGRVS
jgi:DNA-binding transcriptional regulator YdaS (Cro superfamily)